jgi:tetratricopeptide (TPR) repeat protein
VAVSLSLAGASRGEADAFLREQRHHMREQLKEISLRLWELRLGVLLRIATAFIGIVVAAGLAFMIWNAAHADGLIVESFKVPPDLAEKGLSGDVVASQFLDRLSALQAQSVNAVLAPTSITNNWSDDLKVEIPETGVSLGEFNRYLRRWLGHETHISGELVRPEGGNIEITARVNSEAGKSFSGSEADFHALLAKAAEAIYADTQPIRYAGILAQQGRLSEEESLLRAATRTGSASERAWAYTLLSSVLLARNQTAEAIRAGRAGVALNPGFGFGWYRTAVALQRAGVLQAALDAAKKSLNLTATGMDKVVPVAMAQGQAAGNAVIASALGEFGQQIAQVAATFPMIDFAADPATQTHEAETATGGNVQTPIAYQSALAIVRIGQHDLRAARRVLADEPSYMAALKADPVAAGRGQIFLDRSAEPYRNAELALAMETGSWAGARQIVTAMEAEVAKRAASQLGNGFNLQALLWPDLALAEAQMGDFTAAHAEIDKTPGDCDLCLRTRAKIDTLQKNFAGADFWFARLEATEPSIPFADQDWGRLLLRRGDAAKAIEKFKLSNAKGPHFADPLEGWGEALMAQSQSHLALAKFAEAEKYAPNWGRLHLKWGEALAYAGHAAEAKAQFSRAAQLDLTPSEKAELARMTAHV